MYIYIEQNHKSYEYIWIQQKSPLTTPRNVFLCSFPRSQMTWSPFHRRRDSQACGRTPSGRPGTTRPSAASRSHLKSGQFHSHWQSPWIRCRILFPGDQGISCDGLWNPTPQIVAVLAEPASVYPGLLTVGCLSFPVCGRCGLILFCLSVSFFIYTFLPPLSCSSRSTRSVLES